MSGQSYGGAVYISTNNIYYLLTKRSTFIRCSASYDGGAIYSIWGNNVLHNVCGNDCHSDDLGSFAFVGGSDSTETNTKNYVIQLIRTCLWDILIYTMIVL